MLHQCCLYFFLTVCFTFFLSSNIYVNYQLLSSLTSSFTERVEPLIFQIHVPVSHSQNPLSWLLCQPVRLQVFPTVSHLLLLCLSTIQPMFFLLLRQYSLRKNRQSLRSLPVPVFKRFRRLVKLLCWNQKTMRRPWSTVGLLAVPFSMKMPKRQLKICPRLFMSSQTDVNSKYLLKYFSDAEEKLCMAFVSISLW